MFGYDDDDEGFSQPAPIKTRDEVLLEVSLMRACFYSVFWNSCVFVVGRTQKENNITASVDCVYKSQMNSNVLLALHNLPAITLFVCVCVCVFLLCFKPDKQIKVYTIRPKADVS